MSTLSIDVAPPSHEQGPACSRCSGPTRLIGIEPHPVKPQTDLHTFQCMACDHEQASIVAMS